MVSQGEEHMDNNQVTEVCENGRIKVIICMGGEALIRFPRIEKNHIHTEVNYAGISVCFDANKVMNDASSATYGTM